MGTRVHRHTYVCTMEHDKLAYMDHDATAVRLLPLPEPPYLRRTPQPSTEEIQELKSK